MAFSSLKTAIYVDGKTRCLVMSTCVVRSLFLDGYVRISCRVTLLNARDKVKNKTIVSWIWIKTSAVRLLCCVLHISCSLDLLTRCNFVHIVAITQFTSQRCLFNTMTINTMCCVMAPSSGRPAKIQSN